MIILPKRIDLINLAKPGSIGAEIGVYKGWFSVEILQHSQVGKLYLVDAWKRQVWSAHEQAPDEEHEENLRETLGNIRGFGDRAQVVRGTSFDVATNDTSIPPLDWFFLDACHDYDQVYQDLKAWTKRLKPSGVALGHDYTKNDSAKKWGFGVVEAVNDFCAKEEWTLTHLTNEDFASYRLVPNAWYGAEL